jgi:hypothetical protein
MRNVECLDTTPFFPSAGADSEKRMIANQADTFYFSGHGEYSDGSLNLTGVSPSVARFYPTDARWDKDLDYVIIAGCSVLGIRDDLFRVGSFHFRQAAIYAWKYPFSDPSPGEKWELLPPRYKIGYNFSAPRDTQGSANIIRKYYMNLAAGMTVPQAWGAANAGTAGDSACVIDTSVTPHVYWYFVNDVIGQKHWVSTTKGAYWGGF